MGVAGQMCVPVAGSANETTFIAVTNLDPKGYIPPMVVKVGVNKRTPEAMRILKKLTADLETMEKWEPLQLEDLPPDLKSLVAKPRTVDNDEDDEDGEDGEEDGEEDGDDDDSDEARGFSAGSPSATGQLQARLASASAPSAAGFVRDTLAEYEPYLVATVALLTVYNTFRRGKLR
jgi:hypothetical protein